MNNELKKAFELKTLENLKALPTEEMVKLWNFFIEESGWYGSDSSILDLKSSDDVILILKGNSVDFLVELLVESNDYGCRFITLSNGIASYLDDKSIFALLKAYWSEIVTRVMSFPKCYYDLDEIIMADVFDGVIREFVGVSYRENN